MNRDITGAMRGEAKRGEEVCNVESNESSNEEKPLRVFAISYARATCNSKITSAGYNNDVKAKLPRSEVKT